jgi:hypothetical protein
MTSEEKYLTNLHKKKLDEKYLQKQLAKLKENKSEILIRIKNYRLIQKCKYPNSKGYLLSQTAINQTFKNE